MQERDARGREAGWVIVKDALRKTFGPDADIGRVTKIGEGMSHETFAAQIEFYPDKESTSGAYTVELPSRRAEVNRRPRSDLRALLQRVSTQTEVIRVPTVIASVPTVRGMAVARWYKETALEKGRPSASHVLGNLRNVLKHAVQAAL
jgi:hypothetical protein